MAIKDLIAIPIEKKQVMVTGWLLTVVVLVAGDRHHGNDHQHHRHHGNVHRRRHQHLQHRHHGNVPQHHRHQYRRCHHDNGCHLKYWGNDQKG